MSSSLPRANHGQSACQPSLAPKRRWFPSLGGKQGSTFASTLTKYAQATAGAPRAAAHYAADALRFYRTNLHQLKTELLLGLAVSVMMVPESLAFAFTAGLTPVQGLQATVFIGLFAALFGGRPGTVSGMAGALVVIQKDLIIPSPGQNALATACMSDRLQVLWATMFLVGVLQILLGLVRAPKLVSLIPHTVMLGFSNGLALVMAIAQLTAFKVDDLGASTSRVLGAGEPANCPVTETPIRPPQRWLVPSEGQFWLVFALVAVSMVVMEFQPRIRGTLRLFRGRITVTSTAIPATLTAMLLATATEHLVFRLALGVRTTTVGDLAPLRGSTLTWPTGLPILSFSSPYWGLVIQYALVLCAIGSLESILTMDLCASLAHAPSTQRHGVQELVAQGLGNLIAGVFASAGGSALVGQSVLNIQSGARGRLSSVSASLWILAYVVFAGPAIELVPVASLAGILFVVILHMVKWANLADMFVRRIVPWKDCVTVILVTALSVTKDLAVGVVAGVVWSALGHAWDAGRKVEVEQIEAERTLVHPGTGETVVARVIQVFGPLFFASTSQLERILDPPPRSQLLFTDPDATAGEAAASPKSGPAPMVAPHYLLLDVSESVVHDFSAVVAVKDAARKWASQADGTAVGRGGLLVTGLDAHGLRLLQKVGGKTSVPEWEAAHRVETGQGEAMADMEPESVVVWFEFGRDNKGKVKAGSQPAGQASASRDALLIPPARLVADATYGPHEHHHAIAMVDLDEHQGSEARHRHPLGHRSSTEMEPFLEGRPPVVSGSSSSIEADITEHAVGTGPSAQ